MEILAFVILIFFLFFTKLFLSKRGKSKNLPPSPPSLPLIGHLHLLKEPIHRTLHQMVAKYGDVLLLRFGARNVVVVSSLSAATEEFFTKNDVALSNRPLSLAGKHLNYNHKTIGFSQYNDHWRSLRRLTVLELLSNTRIAKFSGIRHEEAQIMVKTLLQEHRPSSSTDESCHSQWTKVELRPKIVDLVFNIMMKMIAGKRYYGNEVVEEEARQFQSIMRELSELLENKNLNDIFPVLQWIDFQGVEKRMITLKNKMDNFFQRLIDENRKNGTGEAKSDANDYERNMTFIELILSLRESNPGAYDDETIKGLMLAMLVAGTDTTTITIEWAMSLLLNHPKAMHKARAEIEANVGHDRLVNESDLPNLSYLHNVINETWRLFPSIPVMPRESADDCTISGFHIPKGTMMLLNVWTIHRDEKVWENATSFMPERFERDGAEANKLFMFGGGRRTCPGAFSARRVVTLALASLIQSFEWERIGQEAVNLAEQPGLHMSMVHPLEALCKPHHAMIPALNKLL